MNSFSRERHPPVEPLQIHRKQSFPSIIPSFSVAGTEPRRRSPSSVRSATSIQRPATAGERRTDTAPFADYAPSAPFSDYAPSMPFQSEHESSEQWAEAIYDQGQEQEEYIPTQSEHGFYHGSDLRRSPSTSSSSTSSSRSRSRRRPVRSHSRGFVGRLKQSVSQLRPSSSTPSLVIHYQSDRSISPPSSAPTSLDVQPSAPPFGKAQEEPLSGSPPFDGLHKMRRRLASHSPLPSAALGSPQRAKQDVLILLPSDSPLARGATTAYARKERKLFAGVRQRGHVLKSCENDEVYASWRTRTPLGYRFSLHRGCAEGPVVMQASTAPFKRCTFGLQRIPTPAVSGSVGVEGGQFRNGDSLGWTGTLRKADYYGQRWSFKLPRREAVPLARLTEQPLAASRWKTGASSEAATGAASGSMSPIHHTKGALSAPTPARSGVQVPQHITTFAVGQVDGTREFEWTGAHVMTLIEKDSGSHRPLATFIRDVTEPKGAGELRYDIDFPDVEVMIITLLTLLDWHSRAVPANVD